MKKLNLTLTKALMLVLLLGSANTFAQPGKNNGNNNNGGNNGGGNCLPVVSANFSADGKTVTAISTKDLSNVVLKYCDGVHQKFEGLSGFSANFSGTGLNTNKIIEGVWIKSGCNNSGDGPGYGTFVANATPNVCNPLPATCYAFEVVSYNPGTRFDFSPVAATRSNPDKALGTPEKNDATTSEANVNFVALGFGGELTVKFELPIKNGPGADVKVWETTFAPSTGNCAIYPETIQAFASQDGCNWKYIGSGCQDAELDLGDLAWAQYIKLIDISERSAFTNVGHIADGYDVDGLECLNGYEANPIFASNECSFATSLISYSPLARKDGQPILAERTNPLQALGAPQRNDSPNFVSLGFGGNIILGFSCVIFDKPGFDIEIVETSYGSPSCNNYPETAKVEGSLDLLSWFEIGTICQDGMLDLDGKGPIQYIRITDVSNPASFSNSAQTDGYDVDGVEVLQPGCVAPQARIAGSSNESTSEIASDIASSNVFPNPFENNITLSLQTGDNATTWNVRVNNIMGQQLLVKQFNSAKNTATNEQIDLAYLPSGVYFITIDNNISKQVFRMIKK